MPDISVKVIRENDAPPMLGKDVAIHYGESHLDCYVLEGGMGSGHPSVAIVADTADGLVVIETSLLAFQAAARAAVGMAETQFGWRMPP
jgi:hypothetical protein